MKIYRQKFSLNRMYRLSDFFLHYFSNMRTPNRAKFNKKQPQKSIYIPAYTI